MSSTDEKIKKHSTATVIILCIFTAFIVYLIAAAPNTGTELNAATALYAEELKDISAKYHKYLEKGRF